MKRSLAILLAMVLALTVVTGCKKTPSGSSSENSGASVATGLSGKVVIYHYMTQAGKLQGMTDLENAFKKINPGVSFEQDYVVSTSYQSTIRQLVAAGDCPDLFQGNPTNYPDIIQTGTVMDLTNDPGMKALGLPQYDLADCSLNGKVYSMPMDYKTEAVFYNKKIFTDLGITADPKNYTEFLADCAKIQASGKCDVFAREYNDQVYPDLESKIYLWTIFGQKNEWDVYKDLMAGTKKFTDFPEFKTSLELWQQRLVYHRLDDMSNDQTHAVSVFASEKAAMDVDGSWNLGEYVKGNANIQVGVFAMPTPDGAGLYMSIIDDTFMVNGQSDGGKIAYQFMKNSLLPAQMALWCKDTAEPPSAKGVDTSTLPQTLVPIMQAHDAGKTVPQGHFSATMYGEFLTKYRAQMQAFAADQFSTKKLTPDSFLAQVQSIWDPIVKSVAASSSSSK